MILRDFHRLGAAQREKGQLDHPTWTEKALRCPQAAKTFDVPVSARGLSQSVETMGTIEGDLSHIYPFSWGGIDTPEEPFELCCLQRGSA